MNLLVTCHHLIKDIDKFKPGLAEENINLTVPEITGQQFSELEMLDLITDVDIAIVGDDFITSEVIAKGKSSRLKTIIKWGIGVDSINLDAAKEQNVKVYNTPGVFGEEVADLAIGMLLSLWRQIAAFDQRIRTGEWPKDKGKTVGKQTIGIVGYGSIGKAVAKRGAAFGSKIYAYDPYVLTDDVAELVELSKLLSDADAIVLTCSLNEDNYHLINEQTLSQIKHGAVIVNVARGPLINESSLISALNCGKISGAALDVFEHEPISKDNPLLKFDNVILGAHNGSNTIEAVNKVNQLTIDMAKSIERDERSSLSKYNRLA